MKNLELSDPEAEALARELAWIVDGDRYPLSPRITVLGGILSKLRPGARPRATAAAEGLRATVERPIPETGLMVASAI
jgi:hypothetical protein